MTDATSLSRMEALEGSFKQGMNELTEAMHRLSLTVERQNALLEGHKQIYDLQIAQIVKEHEALKSIVFENTKSLHALQNTNNIEAGIRRGVSMTTKVIWSGVAVLFSAVTWLLGRFM